MEPLILTLPKMNVICFEAFSPESESKAFSKMKEWLKEFNSDNKPYRIFGHNIDLKGNLTYAPQHAGYKILLYIENFNIKSTNNKDEVINHGKFLVIRSEGQIENVGQWLPEGWNRLNQTIKDKKIKVKESPRWFEEHIRTEKPNYVIVDLYLEIE
jgi:hypothetical protein